MTLTAIFLGGFPGFVLSGEVGTPAEAEAMVKKAVEFIKGNGKDRAFAEFTGQKGGFVDRDLYITVYDLNGKCLAHGANAKMVGKDLIGLTDPDGKAFVKERMEMAKNKDKFWQDYKFTNPVSKKIEPKSMYCEKFGDVIVACGVYKKK
jgi:hypothetical protein